MLQHIVHRPWRVTKNGIVTPTPKQPQNDPTPATVPMMDEITNRSLRARVEKRSI